MLSEALPNIKQNNIPATLVQLERLASKEIYKPEKGLFRLVKYSTIDLPTPNEIVATTKEKLTEQQFYEPFANWLVEELKDCTKAIPLGGSKFRDKWRTPDVIGVLKPWPTDVLQFAPEIISAEIKINTTDLITTFGQACSYLIFSHRSYLVIPNKSPQTDIQRLDSLCQIFGLGLITFDSSQPENPAFLIKTRAHTHRPDMFYANKYLKIVADEIL